MERGSECYERFLKGDDSALEEIVLEYRDGLILYLNSLVGDWHLAEELAEDTFVRLFTKRPEDRKKGSFKTWLYTIARHLAISHHRRAGSTPLPIADFSGEGETEGPETVLIREEKKRCLYRAMDSLKSSHRQVLYLVYLEGMDCSRAARILGKTHHGTQALLSRARAALKTILEKEGIQNEDQI